MGQVGVAFVEVSVVGAGKAFAGIGGGAEAKAGGFRGAEAAAGLTFGLARIGDQPSLAAGIVCGN